MILIVNLNLAVDHIVEVEELRAGEVQRSRGTLAVAGGKGVNVARVLKTLGEESLLSGFAGGRAGELITAGLRAENIASLLTRVREESRTCLIINDRARGQQTVINAPGANVGEAEWRDFEATYTRELPRAGLVIINGSLPPGLPPDTYARMTTAAHAAGGRVLLDCAGAPLGHALGARPFLVKINGAEAAELSGAPVADFPAAARAARHLRERGAENAMITLGEQGALLDFAGGRYRFSAPQVRAVNSVGSGDAALAGLAAALRRGQTAEEAGALAVAAGAANALHGAGGCSAEEIAELRPRVRCEVEEG
ncbi:MAG TPA: 1-phosphofructokinase family hexose kinase [Pyrinomonadaceae bacterium]|nr:1-phosphofructokinase family hexose kinase [Pyrinomonadaceae bacterium]